MARRLGWSNCKTAALVVCTGQDIPKVLQERETGELMTGSRAATNAHGRVKAGRVV